MAIVSQPDSLVRMTPRRFGGDARFAAAPDGLGLIFDGRSLALSSTECRVLRRMIAGRGRPVPAATLQRELGDGSPVQSLWQLVGAINAVLGEGSGEAPLIVHTPEHGFTLVARRPGDAIPPRCPELIGRDDALERIGVLLKKRRLLTIIGPGGIGKSRVAHALTTTLRACFPDGCLFLDLAPLADGGLLPATLAAALDAPHSVGEAAVPAFPQPVDAYRPVVACLKGQRKLVVLDCCERFIDAAAVAAEAVLSASQHIRVVCTSREPLRADGESLFRLPPLSVPEPDARVDRASVLDYDAVRLFVKRTREANDQLALERIEDTDAVMIARLCRQLDGLPLALELAAAMAARLGIARTVDQIGVQMMHSEPVSSKSKRHLSLSAMLDWSWDLLCPTEREVMQRLAVFRGDFTLDAAAAILTDDTLDAGTAKETVIELIGKSLISPCTDGMREAHRLLDTTRIYALEKLRRQGASAATCRRHARYLCSVMDDAHEAWMHLNRSAWLKRYKHWLDDIQAALEWAFSQDGEQDIGIELVIGSFPLAEQAGLMREFSHWIDRALAILSSAAAPATYQLVRLEGFARASLYGPGASLADKADRLEQVLARAEALGDARLQAAPLMALWAIPFTHGDYPTALAASERISAAGARTRDSALALIGLRTGAQSLHFAGAHMAARAAAEEVLKSSWQRIPLHYIPSPVDVDTSMRILLARVMWVVGRSADAEQICEEALLRAEIERPAALCQAIALAAIPLALWSRRHARCEALIDALDRRAALCSFGYWQGWALRYRDVLRFVRGDASLQQCRAIGDDSMQAAMQLDHLATFDFRLLRPSTIARVDAGTANWCAPEIMRARGEAALASDDLAGARSYFVASLALAERQEARAWQLRSATSLARLVSGAGERAQARAVLEPVVQSMMEVGAGHDVDVAKDLLDRL